MPGTEWFSWFTGPRFGGVGGNTATNANRRGELIPAVCDPVFVPRERSRGILAPSRNVEHELSDPKQSHIRVLHMFEMDTNFLSATPGRWVPLVVRHYGAFTRAEMRGSLR